MKANKTTIFLVVLLLLVWGGIGYTIYQSFRGKDNLPVAANHLKTNQRTEITDTFSLLLNYSDPFNLQTNASLLNSNISFRYVEKKQNSLKVEKSPINDVIEFLGALRSYNGKVATVIIKANGVEGVYSIGDDINGYRLMIATDDFVVLKRGSKTLKIALFN